MSKENGAITKSIVRVHFASSNTTLSYFNDTFDLHIGDIVYVEGKLEGQRGRVVDVTYNFKIKVSDYKRVISKADTNVRGELLMAGSHFITFDREVIPYSKVISWYKAPENSEEVYITGNDDNSVTLDDLSALNIKPEIGERGHDYYLNNKVRYLCIDNGHGRAIVEGTKPYEVEFDYIDGKLSGIVCDCFCSYTCKHEVATILQLREIWDYIKENHPEYGDYFAAVNMASLFLFAVDGKKTGTIIL